MQQTLRRLIPPALFERQFALLWFGLMVSIAGTQMQSATLLWHLRDLSDQPVVVSGIGLARFLPILLLAPVGGLLADSYSRRKIMFITQAISMLVALVLGLLTWLNLIEIWHIYLLTAIQAGATAFDLPARQALVPNLIRRKELLPSAFSLTSIASNTGAILGPGLSGVVIAAFGIFGVYIFNAVTFFAVLAALILMGSVQQTTLQAAGQISPLRSISASLASIVDGGRFILKRPIILSSMLLDFVATFFSSAYTLLPFVARDVLKVGATEYGWLVMAESIGAITVGLVFSQLRRVRRQGPLLLAAVVGYGAATILLGTSRVFGLAFLAMMLVGSGDSISTILRNTIRQIQTPDHIRGRMVSINQVFFMGGPQLGEIEAGLMAQAFGTPFAIISGGVGCILGVAAIAVVYPQLRKYDGELAPEAA